MYKAGNILFLAKGLQCIGRGLMAMIGIATVKLIMINYSILQYIKIRSAI